VLKVNESDYFWRLVNTPLYWQDAARDLICGANLLKKNYYSKPRLGFGRNGPLPPEQVQEERYTTARAIIVLYAIAVENLLKAAIIALGKDPIGSDGTIQRWFATHDLVKLAEHARFQPAPTDLLGQLTAFIKAGKYPVGLRDGEAESAHNYFPDTVLARIAELLPTLEAHLDAIPAKGDKLDKADLLGLCVSTTKQRGDT
jgi:hypothetical protein